MGDEVDFSERLGTLLAERKPEGGQAWLAKVSGLEPSTISRLLRGRLPARETLEVLAPALGVTIEALVEGTTAAERLRSGPEFVDSEQFQHAVTTMLDFERKANDALSHLRDAKQELLQEAARGGAARAEVGHLRRELDAERVRANALEQERDRLKTDVEQHQQALQKAVADICQLQAHIGELKKIAESSKSTARATVALAGIAAITGLATMAHYLDENKP
ncbi:MAG TPA: helix-turn-helix transcriptional regulator [Polyangiaceae bacterium]|jgi:transcriptional regulator with XRE-family HTH domain